MAKNFIFGLIILIISVIFYIKFLRLTPTKTVKLDLKGIIYQLEVAQTPAQKSQGLMNRDHLAGNTGMIFISTQETIQYFWMKNTRIPLDIIFLDKAGVIINIATATPQPDTADINLRLYQSNAPSQYVIELNAGDSQKLDLKTGDIIDLSPLLSIVN
jgi:hypothetical protein